MKEHRHRNYRGRRPRIGKPGAAVVVVTRLEPDEWTWLNGIAEQRGVPLALVMREALRDYMLRGPAFEPARPLADD